MQYPEAVPTGIATLLLGSPREDTSVDGPPVADRPQSSSFSCSLFTVLSGLFLPSEFLAPNYAAALLDDQQLIRLNVFEGLH